DGALEFSRVGAVENLLAVAVMAEPGMQIDPYETGNTCRMPGHQPAHLQGAPAGGSAAIEHAVRHAVLPTGCGVLQGFLAVRDHIVLQRCLIRLAGRSEERRVGKECR